ncbi:hypothetical protein KXD40_005774 [Peronospora effusa]|uniref:Uncharacterized protein n=1 Tax=Peronospora effusa TaxID=542832 RepID=A0A425CI38_9STRA|nr:hypothetical protein DD237_001755 [Peronospora effusa]UIZ27701.1 hypothetical protein KXD40_005774 [Peronospora effusa]
MVDYDLAFCLDFGYDARRNRDYHGEDLLFHGFGVPHGGTNSFCFDFCFDFDSCHVAAVGDWSVLRPAGSKT